MSSITETDPSTQRPSFHPGQAIDLRDFERQGSLVVPGYSWAQYLSLDELFQDSGVRLRFLNHYLEIMAPISVSHEEFKTHLGRIVEAWCLDRDIEVFGRGSATLKIPDVAGGEPDESYYFDEKKARPDLVIEVALTSGGLSKRAFYTKFEVPELWIWRNSKLEVHVFDRESGEYQLSESSSLLEGIDLVAVAECAALPSINQAVRAFRLAIA